MMRPLTILSALLFLTGEVFAQYQPHNQIPQQLSAARANIQQAIQLAHQELYGVGPQIPLRDDRYRGDYGGGGGYGLPGYDGRQFDDGYRTGGYSGEQGYGYFPPGYNQQVPPGYGQQIPGYGQQLPGYQYPDYGYGRRGPVFINSLQLLSNARNILQTLPPHQDQARALQAVQRAQQRLSDSRLNPSQQIQFLQEDGAIAIEHINRLLGQGGGQGPGQKLGSLQTSLSFMQNTFQLFAQGLYPQAQQSLESARQIVQRYPQEPQLQNALRHLEMICQILRSQNMHPQAALQAVRQAALGFEDSIKRSQSYARETFAR